MFTRENIVNQIQNSLGAEGSRELAEQVFDILRADDRVYYDERSDSLMIRDGVDVYAVAAEIA